MISDNKNIIVARMVFLDSPGGGATTARHWRMRTDCPRQAEARGQNWCPMLWRRNILHWYTAPGPPRRPAKDSLRTSIEDTINNIRKQ